MTPVAREALAATPGTASSGPANDDVPATPPADLWSQLAGARSSTQLCAAWLALLCEWLAGARYGLVLLRETGDSDRFAPAAVWPDARRDVSFLSEVAQTALTEGRGVTRQAEGSVQCAYPLAVGDTSFGVVVIQLTARGDAAVTQAMRLLHWGAGWLAALPDQRELAERGHRLERLALVQDLLLGALAEPRADDVARWVVNRLAQALPCRTAMLALVRPGSRGSLRVAMVSGSAGFDRTANLLARGRDAMRAALASERPLQSAADAPAPAQTDPAVQEYCHEAGSRAALALPLLTPTGPVGALLLDFDRGIDPELAQFASAIAAALATCLGVQLAAQRSLGAHLLDTTVAASRTLVGPRHPGLKLVGGAALLALAGAAVLPIDDRVSAPATVEGRVQRSAVAPFDGYVVEAPLRPGDTVRRGDMLARMDDRDLRLEEARSRAATEVAERKLREALARGEAVAVRVAEAERDEAAAALDLARDRLARTVVAAPLDGLIVKGDLSQQIGAPVEQGKVLFEVAPATGWRVVLRVDERDVVRLAQGMAGEVVFTGLPGEHFALHVSKVSPVAQAEEGRNAFRVEADLPQRAAGVLPGMEGVGRIATGRSSLLWVGLRRIVDSVRFGAWTLGL